MDFIPEEFINEQKNIATEKNSFVMTDRSDQSLFNDYLSPDFKNIFLEASHF
jgi:hypothetical protein